MRQLPPLVLVPSHRVVFAVPHPGVDTVIRVDVHERFEAAAKEMLEVERTYVACVSDVLVEQQTDWSLPVQFRFVKREETGLVDIEMRSLELVGVEPA